MTQGLVEDWAEQFCSAVDDFDNAIFRIMGTVERSSLTIHERVDRALHLLDELHAQAERTQYALASLTPPPEAEAFHEAVAAELESIVESFTAEQSALAA